MLKLGILGLGQAGSNIADYAITKGFSAVVANTAHIDLNTLKYIPNENKLFLKGFNGAGRDRSIGKSAMVENAESLFELCKAKLNECDIVFIAGGGAGGTGSGALPVATDILLELFPIVNIMYVFPDDLESTASKINAYDCFSELSDNPQIGSIFIIDNDKGRQKLKQPKYMVHKELNTNFIDLVVAVNEFTDKMSYTNNFDERDLFDILSTRGCTLITHTKPQDISEFSDSDLSALIRQSWTNNYSPDYDSNNVIKAAILGNLPKHLSGKFNLSDDETKQDNNCEFYGIYSGLKFPNERLEKIKSDVEKVQDNIAKRIEVSQNQKLDNVLWKINSPKMERQVKDSQVSLAEKLKKFK